VTFWTRLEFAARNLAKRRSLSAWACSALFTGSAVAGGHIAYSGPISAGLAVNHMTPMSPLDFAAVIVATPVFALILLVLADAIEDPGARLLARLRPDTPHRFSPRAMAVLAATFLIAWSPYILTYAPATVLPDSLTALPRGPLAYTAIVRAFVYLGNALGDANIGVFAYSLCQSLLMAAVLAFGVTWIRHRGAPAVWLVAAGAYFAFVPVFPIYALNMQKDTPFSLFLVPLSLLLYEVARSDGALLRSSRGIAAFVATGAGAVFLRSNGIYVVVGTVAALLLFYRKGHLRFYRAVAVLLAAVVLIQGPGYQVLGRQNPPFVEAVGVPLQQMAYVVSSNGAIDAGERVFLDRLLPYELWPRVYAPSLVDTIKWHPRFDEAYLSANKMRFFSTWGCMLVKNPAAYTEAYFLETFGFWKLGARDSYGYADTRVTENLRGIHAIDLFAAVTGVSIKPMLDATRGPEGRDGFVSIGFLLWIMFFAAVLLLLRRRTAYVLAVVPCVALWLSVMVATPAAFGLRYVFALALCLPGFLLLPFVGVSWLGPAGEERQDVAAEQGAPPDPPTSTAAPGVG
jgi:hypothetical protein